MTQRRQAELWPRRPSCLLPFPRKGGGPAVSGTLPPTHALCWHGPWAGVPCTCRWPPPPTVSVWLISGCCRKCHRLAADSHSVIVLEAGGPRSGWPMASFRASLPSVSSPRRERALASLLIKTPPCPVRCGPALRTSSYPSCFPAAPSPRTVTWRGGHSPFRVSHSTGPKCPLPPFPLAVVTCSAFQETAPPRAPLRAQHRADLPTTSPPSSGQWPTCRPAALEQGGHPSPSLRGLISPEPLRFPPSVSTPVLACQSPPSPDGSFIKMCSSHTPRSPWRAPPHHWIEFNLPSKTAEALNDLTPPAPLCCPWAHVPTDASFSRTLSLNLHLMSAYPRFRSREGGGASTPGRLAGSRAPAKALSPEDAANPSSCVEDRNPVLRQTARRIVSWGEGREP